MLHSAKVSILIYKCYCERIVCICQISLDVDGGWAPWSLYPSPCNRECGGGQTTYTRSCTNPSKQGAGADCQGASNETRPCNVELCRSSWSDWSSCNVTCDVGARKRRTLCGGENCTGTQYSEEYLECVDWNKTTCPSPCNKDRCPNFAKCIDVSNETRPMYTCNCVLGYVMDSSSHTCLRPVPPTPTPRPIPTMDTMEKTISIVITRTASTILLVCVGITLGLFILMRIFTADRIIQMNMELAIECSHLLLLCPNTLAIDNPVLCKVVSIGLHFFFTACFMFMFLEALHMYSLVAYVVQRNGLLTPIQNIITGWGVSIVVVLFGLGFHFDDYGGDYQCWLRMDTMLLYAQYIPVVSLVVLTFTLTEAAGVADYKPLDNVDHTQLFSAKISQRCNLAIVTFVFTSWVLGMLSDYEQNLGLYSAFSILNAIIGFSVLILHTLGNQEVRKRIKGIYSKCCSGKARR